LDLPQRTEPAGAMRTFVLAMLQPTPLIEALADPERAASVAGLRYINDTEPGIRRVKCGTGFSYRGPDGKRIADAATLARIRKLALPPAWKTVWIAADPRGHLAATGFDVKGRKQYRYNPEFVAVRDAAKFEHVIAFAEALPALRARVAVDMDLPGLPRAKVLATVVYLLEHTLSRVGNESYAKDNNSFGLTTLRNRHVKVDGPQLKFIFTGKSGKAWRLAVQNRRVAKVVRACQDLPGQNLFEYRDADGSVQRIGSSDVNDYLREVTGMPVSAKDFRTWFGTVEAAIALDTLHESGAKPTKKNLKAAIERAAERLRNTVSICRKCYVHPEIALAYEADAFGLPDVLPREGFSVEETQVLAFLKSRQNRNRADPKRRPRRRENATPSRPPA
jgi:DNA topoisomerase-1